MDAHYAVTYFLKTCVQGHLAQKTGREQNLDRVSDGPSLDLQCVACRCGSEPLGIVLCRF